MTVAQQKYPDDSVVGAEVVVQAGVHSDTKVSATASNHHPVQPHSLEHGHGHEEHVVQQTQIQHVRSQIEEQFRDVEEDVIKRFIRATGGNLPLSIKRLNATLHWRQQTKPELVVCRACARDPRSHYMHLVGYDTLQRPIIYSCLALASNRVYDDNKDHMIQTFEMAIKCMPPGVEQWVWVCDFHGFGMADVNPRLAKAFLDMSAEHYPERLGLIMVVGAPGLFNVLWKAIQPFVDRKTYQKIRFLPFDATPKALAAGSSSLEREMKVHFDPVSTTWLLREMTENRDHKKVPQKAYSYHHIHTSASAGDLAQADCEGGNHDHHDLRGTSQLLAAYQSCPSLLEPQGVTKA